MEHKRGATFDYVVILPEWLEPGTFVGFVPTCQLRDFASRLIAQVPIEWVDPLTTMSLSLQVADTSIWRIGPAVFDISLRREDPVAVIPTSTLLFNIVEKVTRP
jgi:hypothetical protein